MCGYIINSLEISRHKDQSMNTFYYGSSRSDEVIVLTNTLQLSTYYPQSVDLVG